MNLLSEAWVPIRRRDGSEERIPLLDIADPDVLEITAPRADFTAALFQTAVGLLQIAFAPERIGDWSRIWATPPTRNELATAFTPWQDAFELDAETGPAFFQDFDPLAQATPVDIAKLLIDTPGDKTVTDNNDLFLHAGGVKLMCPACAAAALLTLQINAPSGGAGHRVSLRGGGPLTTLRLPIDPEPAEGAPEDKRWSLFHQLWSNVVPSRTLFTDEWQGRADVMPWLAATRTSEDGRPTTPEDAHTMQSYFGMPRRIRLDWKTAAPGICDVCGAQSARCVRQYRTRPYGVNYGGAWQHPLTPYLLDSKQEDLPISIKGQRGGIAYRQWLGLAIGDRDGEGPARAAKVVDFFNRERNLPCGASDARLWCCGYDMDNMKARCWYDATVPLPKTTDLPRLAEAVRRTLECAGEMAALTRNQAREAMHVEGKGEDAVSMGFWSGTERGFYGFVRETIDTIAVPAGIGVAAKRWLFGARRTALEMFDAYVLAARVEQGDIAGTVEARTGLERSFYSGKSKALWTWATDMENAAE